MTAWTSGYVADVGYTYGYYEHMNPVRMRLALLHAGLAYPEVANAFELGFGQGVSINVHAAAGLTNWYGNDFNPGHVAYAQRLAAGAGLNCRLVDDSFAELSARTDLPDFDFIALHGIWSWVSLENKQIILDFIRRKLRVGGVVYASYNTMPGWASFIPLRDLMVEHVEAMGLRGGGTLGAVKQAIEFVSQMLDHEPHFARVNLLAAERFRQVKGADPQYLAHEYFNRDWTPMPFSAVARLMATAKLEFACSADEVDYVDGIHLTEAQQTFIAGVSDRTFRETVRDHFVNRQFRRDYWVKGPRKLSDREQDAALLQHKVALVSHRPDVPLKVQGSQGEVQLVPEVYSPLLDALADHKPRTLAQIEPLVRDQGLSLGQILQAIVVLTSTGHVVAVQEEAVANKAAKVAARFNTSVIERSHGSKELPVLASPVSGGGVVVDRFQQLFLAAMSQGAKLPSEWAAYAWRALCDVGERVLKDGKILESEEENLAELTTRAQAFAQTRLPALKVLRVA